MTTNAATMPPQLLGVGRATRYLAWANLIAQIVIIVTGGLVRLTASGLGCSDWPYCEPGQFSPTFHEATSYHAFVEFGNRTLTGVLTVIAVAFLVAAIRERGRSRAFKVLAATPLIGIAIQAVVGGITVHVELDPRLVSSHMLISVALVWVSALLVRRCGEGDAPPRAVVARAGRTLAWLLAVCFIPVALLGVVTTGAGPHSGDAVRGYRFAIDPVMAARFHAGAVWLFVIVLIVFIAVLYRSKAPAGARTSAWWLAGIVAAQGAVGYAQFGLGLPIGLVAVHMLGIALTTAALTFAVLATRERGAIAPPDVTDADVAARSVA